MGWSTTIKTGCEAAIRANTDLDDAAIFDRPESPEDSKPDGQAPQIFMRELPIKPNKVAGALRFKIYPIEFVLVFDEPPVRTDETEPDAVRRMKDDYNEALYTALLTTNPWSTQPIDSDIYQVDDVSRELDPTEIPAAVLAKRGDLHRIRQIWEFNVNET
jgi:hypothetical protein